MNAFADWLATSPLATALKSFIAIVLSLAVADWTAHGSISFSSWQTWVIAGLVACVPVVVNALNPSDTRYGKGAK